MPNQKWKSKAPRINHDAKSRIVELMRSVYFPPDTSPISNEQVDLLLALRRKERERNHRL
jgi:hypothetical protein